ncbi:MAG: CehA/McbA family metallohydrolase [Solirubrobacterales bacterium]
MRLRITLICALVSVGACPAALAGTEPPAARDDAARTAAADHQRTVRATALTADGCSGDAIEPDRVIEGSFTTDQQGSYVMVPFTVPAGTTAVRVKYCFDQPEVPVPQSSHTLDLGLYEARSDARRERVWGLPEFRGWGGSSHPDVTVSPEGFSSETAYVEDPDAHVPGRTTRAFRPGPIPAGTWAAELGVAAVAGRDQGDTDGRVRWRVEVELSDDARFADRPYRRALYDDRPARSQPGWYAGDMHVHAEHSAQGDATMRETFDYAFGEPGDGAGLDFITLSDYVSNVAWGEIGRHQPRYEGKLIVRSSEVITYRGHFNNHASVTDLDYRHGPILERRPDGQLVRRRGELDPRAAFNRVTRAGGFTQINHPTIFPSEVPAFRSFCRGCPWDYSGAETDYRLVDGFEIQSGPATVNDVTPNPFTLTAIDEWEGHLADGNGLAAVGVSDSHNAGKPENELTQTPIGQATTVVGAQELSECGINQGVQAGRTYVKLFGNSGPDIRLTASPPGGGPEATMGDTLIAPSAQITATVLGADRNSTPRPGPAVLALVRDGETVAAVPIDGSAATRTFPDLGPGRYRIEVRRGELIEVLSSPVTVLRGPTAVVSQEQRPCREALALSLSAPGTERVGDGRFATRCVADEGELDRCRVSVRARSHGATRTIGSGRAQRSRATGRVTVAVRLTRAGRQLVRREGAVSATLVARGSDGFDRERTANERIRLLASGADSSPSPRSRRPAFTGRAGATGSR